MITNNPNDPQLTHGVDHKPTPQANTYLVLSEEELAKDFVRPVRRSYLHLPCGTVTTMDHQIAETYARQPDFYGATYCVDCAQHRPVGSNGEFVWIDDNGYSTGQKVGT